MGPTERGVEEVEPKDAGVTKLGKSGYSKDSKSFPQSIFP